MEPVFYEANGKAIEIKPAHAFVHENVHAQDENTYNLGPAILSIKEEMEEYMEREDIDVQTKIDAGAVFSKNIDRIRDSQEYLAISDVNEMRQEEGLPIRANYVVPKSNSPEDMAGYQLERDKRPLSADMLLPPTSSDQMRDLLRPKYVVSPPFKGGASDGKMPDIAFDPDSSPLAKAIAAFNDDSWQPSEETVEKTASDVPTQEQKEALKRKRPDLFDRPDDPQRKY